MSRIPCLANKKAVAEAVSVHSESPGSCSAGLDGGGKGRESKTPLAWGTRQVLESLYLLTSTALELYGDKINI